MWIRAIIFVAGYAAAEVWDYIKSRNEGTPRPIDPTTIIVSGIAAVGAYYILKKK